MEIDLQQVAQALLDATLPRYDVALCAARNSHYALLDIAWGCVVSVITVAFAMVCVFAGKIWGHTDREFFQPLFGLLAFIGTATYVTLFTRGWSRLNFPEIYIYRDMCHALLGGN